MSGTNTYKEHLQYSEKLSKEYCFWQPCGFMTYAKILWTWATHAKILYTHVTQEPTHPRYLLHSSAHAI